MEISNFSNTLENLNNNKCDFLDESPMNLMYDNNQINCEDIIMCIDHIIRISNSEKCFSDHLKLFTKPKNTIFSVVKGKDNVKICYSCNKKMNVNMFLNILYDFYKNCYPKLVSKSASLQKPKRKIFKKCPVLDLFFKKNIITFYDIKINVQNYYIDQIQESFYDKKLDSFDSNLLSNNFENNVANVNKTVESLDYNPFLASTEIPSNLLSNESKFKIVFNDSKKLQKLHCFFYVSLVFIFLSLLMLLIWIGYLIKKKFFTRR